MTLSIIEISLPLLVLATAFAIGPTVLVARGMLRPAFGAQIARARAPGLTVGLGLGALAATVASGMAFGWEVAATTACLALLMMLAAMDVVWRWLPLEWTLPLLGLGLSVAFLAEQLTPALWGVAVGGGVLLILRWVFKLLRGVEAIGIGDIWLAAALGSFVGPAAISWLLGAAAVLGLVLHFALRTPKSNRYGVAFGAQLCAVAPFFLYF